MKYFLSCIILCLLNQALAAGIDKGGLRKADKLYKKGNWDAAINEYNKILAAKGDSDIINFKLGSVYYRKPDYSAAQNVITKALSTEKKGLELKANYNLGNTKYKQGVLLQQEGRRDEAVNLLKESLLCYKRAMHLDQRDKDSRFNYEFVSNALKKIQENQKEQGSGLEQSKDNAKEQKQQDDKQGGGKNPQDNQSSDEQKKQEDSAGRQPHNKESGDSREQPEQTDKKKEEKGLSDADENGAGEMSREQAYMLLEGSRQDEVTGQLLPVERQRQLRRTLKDW